MSQMTPLFHIDSNQTNASKLAEGQQDKKADKDFSAASLETSKELSLETSKDKQELS